MVKPIKSKPTLLALIAGSSILVGCSHMQTEVVRSKHVAADGEKGSVGRGLIYGLPKAQAQISIHRRPGTSDQLTKLRNDAADALKKATDAESAAELAKDKDKKKATALQEKTKSIYEKLNEKAEDLASKTWQEEAVIQFLPYVPDPEVRYSAEMDHVFTRDDDLKLTVANGLLSSTDVTSTDQLPNIIISLAEAAALLAGAPAMPATNVSSLWALKVPLKVPLECQPYEVSMIIDPTLKSDWQRLQEKLPSYSAFTIDVDVAGKSKISITPPPPKQAPAVTSDKKESTVTPDKKEPPIVQSSEDKSSPTNGNEGLHYRALTPVTVAVQPRNDMENTNCQFKTLPQGNSITALVPDRMTDFALNVEAGPFVTTKLGYKFKDGSPTDYTANRPSEAMSVVSLPATIAKKAVSVVTEFIQLKVNQDTQATALVKGQTDMATAIINDKTQKTKDETDKINAEASKINAEAAKIAAEKSYNAAVDAKAKDDLARAAASH